MMDRDRLDFPFTTERPVLLAPMAGFTDTYFRQICSAFGADGVVSEMISADGLVRKNDRGWDLAAFEECERPVGVQLFGSSPETLSEAAGLLERVDPDFVDLNFGCPVKKVVKRNCGSALMRDPELMGRIALEVTRSVGVPISAKVRAGWDADSVNAPEAAAVLEKAGVAFITVHGRTRSQNYSEPSSLQVIGDVVKAVDVPVIGNGDVFSPEDAAVMLEETGCRGVMVARGAFGQPWIFRQIKSFLAEGGYGPPPGIPERFALLYWQIGKVVERMGEKRGVCWMRKHVISFTRGLPGGVKLRRASMKIVTMDGLRNLLDEYLSYVMGEYDRELFDVADLGDFAFIRLSKEP